MLFDSHCHLTDDAFDADRGAVLARARDAGVAGLVTIASTPDDTLLGVELAEAESGVWTTAGVHPHRAGEADEGTFLRIRELLDRPRVVAVGECGLDYHYDNAPRNVQRRVFRRQIEMAAETGHPLVIHARSCDADMAAALRDAPAGARGVVHCFTGSDDLLETALEAGFHVSFTGIVTFGSWSADHQIRAVPRDRIMVETDAPYLAPAPWRGKRNEPARVVVVAEAVARARDVPFEEIARLTTANARRFYGLDG